MKNNNYPELSIIIPVLNEEIALKQLLPYLQKNAADPEKLEIIIADGGSTDSSIEIAKSYGVTLLRCRKGRARQMNKGASLAKGKILYFLHADCLPPKKYDQHIRNAVYSEFPAGCFRLKFDNGSAFLNFFAWCSRFNFPICRGGDQSLFITSSLFIKLKGFNEAFTIYEDNEFTGRIYRTASFKVLPLYLITSSRRYQKIGQIRLQFHFAMIHLLKFLGFAPKRLHSYYLRYIN